MERRTKKLPFAPALAGTQRAHQQEKLIDNVILVILASDQTSASLSIVSSYQQISLPIAFPSPFRLPPAVMTVTLRLS